MDLKLENLEKAIRTQKQQDVFFTHRLNKALHLQSITLLTLDELLELDNAYDTFYEMEENRATGN